MVVFPNAKINIGLDILRRRPDGYHDITTAMVPVNWCDILEIVPAAGAVSTLTVSGRVVDCPAEKNLVMKALRRLNEEVEIPPVDIFLRKIIPDGAGLGGGSADAAFTLRALNAMFSLGFTDRQLAEMALDLGADCPFFIYNVPAMAEGKGERLTPLQCDFSTLSVAIAKPPLGISTAEAYAGVTPLEPASPLSGIFTLPAAEWGSRAVNAFQTSLAPRYPEITVIVDEMKRHGAVYASLSGSGSAVFGLFSSDNLAENAARDIARNEGYSTFAGKLGSW